MEIAMKRSGKVKFDRIYGMGEIPNLEEVLRFVESDATRAVA